MSIKKSLSLQGCRTILVLVKFHDMDQKNDSKGIVACADEVPLQVM